jgi:hypothetical protein
MQNKVVKTLCGSKEGTGIIPVPSFLMRQAENKHSEWTKGHYRFEA